MPRNQTTEPVAGNVTAAVQNVTAQQQTYYPTQQQQVYAAPHYPQQMQPQPAPITGYVPYPAQATAATPAYPQTSTPHPPYNPAFGPDSSFPVQPPPYEAIATKQGGDVR